MARYSLDEFKSLVLAGQWDYLNQARAWRTLDKLDWTDDDFCKVLLALHNDDCQKTVLNNKVNDLPGIELIDGDQYEIHWNEDLGCREPRYDQATFSISLKIAIVTVQNGPLAGVVTMHLSGSSS